VAAGSLSGLLLSPPLLVKDAATRNKVHGKKKRRWKRVLSSYRVFHESRRPQENVGCCFPAQRKERRKTDSVDLGGLHKLCRSARG